MHITEYDYKIVMITTSDKNTVCVKREKSAGILQETNYINK